MDQNPLTNLEKAFKYLSRGRPVIIYDADDREGECDLVFLADSITPNTVAQLRKEAGGLICACLPYQLASLTGIPFLEDVLVMSSRKFPILDDLVRKTLAYDTRSSFSVTINHRKTRTGIPDRERAKTLKELHSFAQVAEKMVFSSEDVHNNTKYLAKWFSNEFYSPGHVFLLIGAPKLTQERQGHTELSLALARMATSRLFPITVICEMLDEKSGTALSINNAKKWAMENDAVVVLGEDIIMAFECWLDQLENTDETLNITQNQALEAKKW